MELDPNTLEGFAKYEILNNDSEDKATHVILPKIASGKKGNFFVRGKSKLLVATSVITLLIIAGCIVGLFIMNKRIEDLKHLNQKLMNNFQDKSQILSSKLEGMKLQNQHKVLLDDYT